MRLCSGTGGRPAASPGAACLAPAVVWVFLLAGCAGAPRTKSSAPVEAQETAVLKPTAEQVREAAPSLARALGEWRSREHANRELVLRGPMFVGLAGTTAGEATSLGRELGRALNEQGGSEIHFLLPGTPTPEDLDGTAAILDSRAMWEPSVRIDRQRRSRLTLEVVDPRTGRTVFSADSEGVPTSSAPAPGSVARATDRAGLPAGAEPRTGSAPPAAQPARPARVRAEDGRSAAVPPRAAVRRSSRVGAPAPSDPSPANRGRRAMPPGPSPVIALSRGAIYLADAKLAERIGVLEERTAALAGGEISVRLVLLCRRGKAALELRCEFFDARGAPAGTVKEVELRVREGRPTTIALASRRPASYYVLFVRD